MAVNMSGMESPWKGKHPHTHTYRHTPAAHTSTCAMPCKFEQSESQLKADQAAQAIARSLHIINTSCFRAAIASSQNSRHSKHTLLAAQHG